MTSAPDSPLPNDVATLQTMLLSERAARLAAESEAKYRALLIEKLKYTIAKLRHQRFGQPPAPSHPIARGRAGPGLLAHVLFSKYGLHLPLNRQSAAYAREGIELDVSTLADWVSARATAIAPRHVIPGSGQPGSHATPRGLWRPRRAPVRRLNYKSGSAKTQPIKSILKML